MTDAEPGIVGTGRIVAILPTAEGGGDALAAADGGLSPSATLP